MNGDTLGRHITESRIKEMVGRESELARLLSWSNSSTGKRLWVYGKAGTGKTTLLQAFALSLTADSKNGKQLIWHTMLPEEGLEYLLMAIKERHSQQGQDQAQNDVNYIWVIDGFREIDAPVFDEFLNVAASWLQENCRMIIVSRQVNGADESGAVLEIKNFDEKLTQFYWEKRGLNLELSRQSYNLTGGNPLLLSLLAAAVKRSGYRLFYDMLGGMMEAGLIKEAVLESVDAEVWPLLETAALLPAFTSEVLEAVGGAAVTDKAFISLTKLPFISCSGTEWFMHELVSHVLNESFRRESPDAYRKCRASAFRYFRKQMEQNTVCGDRFLRYCVCLSESYIARQVLLAGVASGAQLQEMQQAREYDLEKIAECWYASIACYSGIGLYDTIEPQSEVLPEHADLERLLALGPQFFRTLKDKTGLMLGYHATLPVCRETIRYLTNSPAMREYFATLSAREVKRLKNFEPGETDTYVLRHLTLRNPADTASLGAMMRDILPVVLGKCRIITSATIPTYHQLALGMGFWEVPGVYDTGFGYQSPVLVLDLREMELGLWLEWLVMGGESPPWLDTLVRLPVWQWHREIQKALNSLNHLEQLGKTPLAPLAAVLTEVGDEEVSPMASSAEILGKHLRAWLEQEITALLQEVTPQDKSSNVEHQAGKLLATTYMCGKTKRTQAALNFWMSEATYYRWLQKSWVLLADRMRRSAIKRMSGTQI